MGLEHSHGSLLTDNIRRYSHQTWQLSQDLALEGTRSLADVRGWVPETARRTQGRGLGKRLPDQLQPLHQRGGLRPCASTKCQLHNDFDHQQIITTNIYVNNILSLMLCDISCND
jgi:hypothetical protein